MLKRARLLCYLVLCVSQAVLSVVLGAWSVSFVGWADFVDCRCFLSFVFLGVARRLELSPCNTTFGPRRMYSSMHVMLMPCHLSTLTLYVPIRDESSNPGPCWPAVVCVR